MGLASETVVETESLTLLLIGDGDLRDALSAALEAAGQDVEHAELEHALAAVTAAAPDLVVLIASRDGDAQVAAVLAALADDRTGSVAPLVLVGESELPNVAPNYRQGAVATLSSKLPVAKLAQRLVDIGNGVPDRSGLSQGPVPNGQVGSLLGGLSGQKRTGKLTVSDDKGREHRSLVLKSGESITEPAHEFVAKAGALVEPAGGRFKFEERTTARIDSVLPPAPAGVAAPVPEPVRAPAPVPAQAAPRLLVVDSNPALAAGLARALGQRGAEVRTLASRPGEMEALLDFDPQVVLVSARELSGACEASVAAIEAHPRLRWASLLVTPDGMVSPSQPGGAALDALWAKVDKLVQPDRELAQGAAGTSEFATRLELIGPARTLRAVASAGVSSRVLIRHPRVSVELAVGADGAVRARARARERGNEPMDGALAIASLFAIQSGRVQVRRAVTAPTGAESLDALLRAALAEAAPIRSSLAPAAGEDAPGSEPAKTPAQAVAAPSAALPPPPAATLRIQDLITAALQPSVSPTPGASGAQEPSAAHPIGATASHDAPAAPPPLPPIVAGSDVLSLPPDERLEEHPSPPPLPRSLPEPPRALFAAAPAEPPPAVEEPLVDVQISLPAAEPEPEPEPEPERAFASLSLGGPGLAIRRMDRVRIGLGALAALLLVGGLVAWWSGDRPASEPTAAAPAPEVAAAPAPSASAVKSAAGAQARSASGASGAAPARAQEPAAVEAPAGAEAEPAPGSEAAETDEDALAAEGGPHARELQEAAKFVSNATIYRRQGRLGLAEAAYLRALAVFPKYPRAIAGVVRVHLDRKDGREAVRWAEQLVAMQPNRSNNQLLLGDAYALRGQQSAAVAAWKLSAKYGNHAARQRLGDRP